MTLKDCYFDLGGDYESVMGRLHSERLVQKFALKFLDDPSFASLREAMDARDQEVAFRASHTIKGVCQNLSFTRLYESSHQLTEALRDGWSPEADTLFLRVSEDYQATADALRAFQASLEG